MGEDASTNPTETMRKALEFLIDRLQEAHDTHIYDADDPHPADCVYCEAIQEGQQALAESLGRGDPE